MVKRYTAEFVSEVVGGVDTDDLVWYTDYAELEDKLIESDRLCGQLYREKEYLQESHTKRQQWLSDAKRAAGYPDNISFDVVWNDALKALLKSKGEMV